MKVVHEVYGKPQVGGWGKPYHDKPGARMELVIVCEPIAPNLPNEVIHIEGDAEQLRELFTQALDAVDLMLEDCERKKVKA